MVIISSLYDGTCNEMCYSHELHNLWPVIYVFYYCNILIVDKKKSFVERKVLNKVLFLLIVLYCLIQMSNLLSDVMKKKG